MLQVKFQVYYQIIQPEVWVKRRISERTQETGGEGCVR
jgi:hypothetical protein